MFFSTPASVADHILSPVIKPTAEFMRITKATAEELLRRSNTDNRAVATGHVKQLVDSMNNNAWITGVDSLVFDKNLCLINGQQRLTALLASELDHIDFVVVRGVDVGARDVRDRGIRWKASSALEALLGLSRQESTSFSQGLQLLHDFILKRLRALSGGGSLSPVQIKGLASAYRDFVEEARTTCAPFILRKNKRGQVTTFTGSTSIAFYIGARINGCSKHDLEDYFTTVITGVCATVPLAQLRTLLMKADREVNASVRSRYILGLAIKAWNAHATGKEIKLLTFRATEAVPAFAATPENTVDEP